MSAHTWFRSWLAARSTRKARRRVARHTFLRLEHLEHRDVPSAPTHFDFGMAGSPVGAGYVGVSAGTTYTSALGYGWLAGTNLTGQDRGTGSALGRDFVQAPDETFAVSLPNGAYAVTLTMGDASFARGPMTVAVE